MAAYVPYPFHGNPKAYLWSELNRIAAAIAGGGITNLSPASAAVVLTPNPILGAGTIGVSANLNAYSGGDTPSAFTLGIVDSVDAAAWRAAIGAGTSTVTPAALTKTDDTNVTLTLGGTPTTALLQAASITVGWAGQLGPTRGGTGIGTYTTGDILYASAANVLSKLAVGSNGNVLTLAAGVPTWAAASGSSPLTTKGDVFGYSTVNARIPIGTDGQVLTADSAQTLGLKWAAPAAGTAGNPTASVGLTAVNGSATTYMRSDGAPPIDQGIAPTWTSQHIFANILRIHSAAPQYIMKETDAGSDLKEWICYANSAVLTYGVMNDAESVIKNYLQITRSAGAPATMVYGNGADNPTHTMHGTPTFNVASGGTFTVNMYTNGALFESPSGNNARIRVSTLSSSGNLADIRFATDSTDRAYVGVPLNGGSFFTGGTANAMCVRGEVAVQFGVSSLLSGTLDSAGRWYFPQIHNNGSGATGTTPMVASGTYSPTGTNVANAGSLSMQTAQWMRVGNVVTVSGSFTFTAAGTATTTVGISLPIASALASAGQLAGSAAREETAGVFAASVITDATNDRAQVQLGAIVAAAACTVHYTFTYVVV